MWSEIGVASDRKDPKKCGVRGSGPLGYKGYKEPQLEEGNLLFADQPFNSGFCYRLEGLMLLVTAESLSSSACSCAVRSSNS